MSRYSKSYIKQYHRYGKYSIEEVRKLWNISKAAYESDGEWPVIVVEDKIKFTMESDRYENFFVNGTDCVRCGVKGKYFLLETTRVKKSNHGAYYNNKWHFNLYGIDENGEEIQITKDHIIPKSRGGKDAVSNYQPMCEKCNQNKGNKLE